MNPAARRLVLFLILCGVAAPPLGAQEAPPAALEAPPATQEAPPPDEAAQAAAAAEPAPDRPVLELSLEDAVARALQNNVDIAVQKFVPESSQAAVTSARGAYDPELTSSYAYSSQTSPGGNIFAGGVTVVSKDSAFSLGAQKLLGTGGLFSLSFDTSRQTTDSQNVFFSPQFNTTLTLRASQPLARNFRIDAPREQLRVAKNNVAISDAQFRETVIGTIANAKKLYYDLLFGIDNLEAQRKNLALAQKLLDENRIRVRVGTLAPLDVVSAESEVASREEAVIVAENGLAEAEDAVKQAIFPENSAATWALRIVPTDRPTAEPRPVDAELAVRTALDKRTDLFQARKSLENQDLSLRLARNQLLPSVNVVAAYGATGLGGTQVRAVTGEPGELLGRTGFGDTLSSVFGRDFPTWTVGVNVAYPLFNRAAEGSAARARLAREQAQASLRRLELQVAGEVRSAARAVETNYKRVESTRAARRLSVQRLEAEEKRFAAGMSTNFLVTQAQRDLAVAEVAEVRAVADYRKSLIDFERVQEAGLGAGGFVQ
jgi:outer membrane protein TolC